MIPEGTLWQRSARALSMIFAASLVSAPAIAQTADPTPTLVAQDIIGQCRATQRSTPVFEAPDTLSAATRLLSANQQVTLSSNVTNNFVRISAPSTGFVQAPVLKLCPTTPPPTRTACRLLQNAEVVNVRREPDIPATNPNSNVITTAYRGDRVYVFVDANGNVISTQADGFNWVQIDLNRAPFNRPGTGWIYNSPISGGVSNLVLCP